MYKYIRHILLPFVVTIALLTSCEGMYDTLNDYAGEIIYPAKFDTVVGYIGYNRVEIDLLKAGRIPANQIVMGKAKKTVVEYDDEKLIIDTLASWLNIENLTMSKLYRFYIYTIDEFENKSVPQEIALIPFTDSDKSSLTISTPKIMYSTTSAILEWGTLSNVIFDYINMAYEYTDKDGVVQKGVLEQGALPRIFISNLEAESTVQVKITYNVIPKIDGKRILDEIPVESIITLTMPNADTPFSVEERDILEANGITTFTANGVKDITKLVYPLTANSVQDLFYFPALKELDLTGGTLFNITSQTYDRNGVVSIIGGKGKWEPFIRKVSPIPVAKMQALKDLLEANILEKVTYIPHSMGLDDLLAPYVATGVVKLVSMPEKAFITNDFILNERVQTNDWEIDKVYPATDAPAGAGTETYKITLKKKNSSFVISLPKEYRFNTEEYKYLEMEVYAPSKSVLSDSYSPYNRLWFRMMNYLWAFTGDSSFGQETWQDFSYYVQDDEFQKWTTIRIDLNALNSRHTRVIVINIGGEPSLTFAPPTPNPFVYYISNMRFSKQ